MPLDRVKGEAESSDLIIRDMMREALKEANPHAFYHVAAPQYDDWISDGNYRDDFEDIFFDAGYPQHAHFAAMLVKGILKISDVVISNEVQCENAFSKYMYPEKRPVDHITPEARDQLVADLIILNLVLGISDHEGPDLYFGAHNILSYGDDYIIFDLEPVALAHKVETECPEYGLTLYDYFRIDDANIWREEGKESEELYYALYIIEKYNCRVAKLVVDRCIELLDQYANEDGKQLFWAIVKKSAIPIDEKNPECVYERFIDLLKRLREFFSQESLS